MNASMLQLQKKKYFDEIVSHFKKAPANQESSPMTKNIVRHLQTPALT